ncbi:MAG TPA: histidine kinase [Jiangellaceae bacterium]
MTIRPRRDRLGPERLGPERLDPELPGLLPALLIAEPGYDDEPLRVRRTPRDWFVDVTCFLLALGIWLLVFAELVLDEPGDPSTLDVVDLIVGVLAVPAVWLRRRWPLGLAVVMLPVSVFSSSAGGTSIIALLTVAVHFRFTITAAITAANIVTGLAYVRLRPDPSLSWQAQALITVLGTIVVVMWGMFVRARRQLVFSLRERAKQAESEAHLRVEQARHLERARIAREMHDVLAHRLSLLSVHAGALEYRPGAPPDDVARAAGVIRTSAHQALQDLREVIGVLRTRPDAGEPEAPQPALGDLPALVGESRAAGMTVHLEDSRPLPADPPAGIGRCAYRVVQEGLTNARKHAPHSPVTVVVDGTAGDGLRIEVRNRLTSGVESAAAIPGAGSGIVGLTERVALAGGRLEHGRSGEDDFRLAAWLPWPP